MKFLQLLPAQIAEQWRIIKWSIEKALPPIAKVSAESMNNILESLLNGVMQCWVGAEGRKIETIILTTVMIDENSKTKSLLVYSFVGLGISEDLWKEAIRMLTLFGKSKGCTKVNAYTDEEKIKDAVVWLGGSTGYFVSIPI